MSKEIFLEQVKFISNLKAISEQKFNYQTLHHALCVEPACLKNNSGEIYEQAFEFVELMIARGENQTVEDPAWLQYTNT